MAHPTLAWRRRFDPARVRRVGVGRTSWETNGKPNEVIAIEADRTIKFGSLLRDDRREWLQAILHELLVKSPHQRREVLSQATYPVARF